MQSQECTIFQFSIKNNKKISGFLKLSTFQVKAECTIAHNFNVGFAIVWKNLPGPQILQYYYFIKSKTCKFFWANPGSLMICNTAASEWDYTQWVDANK